ncbi:MAG TPA: hypothetical protein VFE98_04420 [Candidatus Bathyarchaeia archaeon]|nr:hypothetical protein [Candidatus Bathyarchaeia archaeon]
MSGEAVPNFEKLKTFMRLQQNEVGYHWTRNNYFLLTQSILLVAYFPTVAVANVQFSIALVGIFLNIIWLLIHYDSNRLIKYWNGEIEQFREKLGFPPFYSRKGFKIRIREISLTLPAPFLILWIYLFAYSLKAMGF